MKFKQSCKFIKHAAFTLAEVLIVLGIIGIIAELTIPTLMTSFQQQSTVVKLKETYSILNNALGMAKVEYGTDIGQWTIKNSSDQEAATSFTETYLLKYIKTVEICGTSNAANCTYNIYDLNNPGNVFDTRCGAAGFYTFKLINGVLLSVIFWDSSSNILANDRFVVFIDVNAQDKPNIMGKDIFLVEPGGDFGGPDKNKLVPYGHSTSRSRSCYLTGSCEYDWSGIACNKTTGNGGMCMALIMVDSWQIKDDYPW